MGVGQQGFFGTYSKPLGYQQYTSLGSATSLSSIPAGATYAVITVEGAGIRWRDDGVAPTASIGMPVASGSSFSYEGSLGTIQFIQQIASATINITYFG